MDCDEACALPGSPPATCAPMGVPGLPHRIDVIAGAVSGGSATLLREKIMG